MPDLCDQTGGKVIRVHTFVILRRGAWKAEVRRYAIGSKGEENRRGQLSAKSYEPWSEKEDTRGFQMVGSVVLLKMIAG